MWKAVGGMAGLWAGGLYAGWGNSVPAGVFIVCCAQVAILALKQSGNHLDCATELLFDEDKKNKLKAEVKKKRKSVTLDENTSNLLLLTLRYVKQRMEVSTRYCIVCDKPHPIQLLKPVVCSDDLCNFQFTNMGMYVCLRIWSMQQQLAMNALTPSSTLW